MHARIHYVPVRVRNGERDQWKRTRRDTQHSGHREWVGPTLSGAQLFANVIGGETSGFDGQPYGHFASRCASFACLGECVENYVGRVKRRHYLNLSLFRAIGLFLIWCKSNGIMELREKIINYDNALDLCTNVVALNILQVDNLEVPIES